MSEAYGRVYCATCRVNGKRYVGQTVQALTKRVAGHLNAVRTGSQLPFHRALRKHGRSSFQFQTLTECTSLDSLNDAEAVWIAKLGSFGPGGYNCTTGGEGFEVCAETREKISRSRTGMQLSDSHRQHISEAMQGTANPFFGKRHKPESIEQGKAKLRGRFSGEKNPFYGRTHSPEAREKMSAQQRGRKMSLQCRAALAKANKGNQYTKGHKLTVEHREKLSHLTLGDVRYIRRNPDSLSRVQLAETLGVGYNSVRFVQTGKTWVGVE